MGDGGEGGTDVQDYERKNEFIPSNNKITSHLLSQTNSREATLPFLLIKISLKSAEVILSQLDSVE